MKIFLSVSRIYDWSRQSRNHNLKYLNTEITDIIDIIHHNLNSHIQRIFENHYQEICLKQDNWQERIKQCVVYLENLIEASIDIFESDILIKRINVHVSRLFSVLQINNEEAEINGFLIDLEKMIKDDKEVGISLKNQLQNKEVKLCNKINHFAAETFYKKINTKISDNFEFVSSYSDFKKEPQLQTFILVILEFIKNPCGSVEWLSDFALLSKLLNCLCTTSDEKILTEKMSYTRDSLIKLKKDCHPCFYKQNVAIISEIMKELEYRVNENFNQLDMQLDSYEKRSENFKDQIDQVKKILLDYSYEFFIEIHAFEEIMKISNLSVDVDIDNFVKEIVVKLQYEDVNFVLRNNIFSFFKNVAVNIFPSKISQLSLYNQKISNEGINFDETIEILCFIRDIPENLKVEDYQGFLLLIYKIIDYFQLILDFMNTIMKDYKYNVFSLNIVSISKIFTMIYDVLEKRKEKNLVIFDKFNEFIKIYQEFLFFNIENTALVWCHENRFLISEIIKDYFSIANSLDFIHSYPCKRAKVNYLVLQNVTDILKKFSFKYSLELTEEINKATGQIIHLSLCDIEVVLEGELISQKILSYLSLIRNKIHEIIDYPYVLFRSLSSLSFVRIGQF